MKYLGLYRTDAIVIRSRKYSEADSLLTLLTEKKGKVQAIAKGVRKTNSRLRGGVQVFTLNDMLLYQGRNLDTVTQSLCKEAFTPLHDDIKAVTAASYWCELLDKIIPSEERDATVFHLALAGLHVLSIETSELVIRALEIKLLTILGYKPYLEGCTSCGKEFQEKDIISFSTAQGGLLCLSCSTSEVKKYSYPFTLEAIAVWKQLLRMELHKVNRMKIKPACMSILGKTLDEFIIMQLDYPLKSKAVLNTMLQM